MTYQVLDNGVLRDATPDEIAEIEARSASASPSPAQIVAGYMAAIQKYLDDEAVRFGYDNIVSAISYAEEPAVPRYQGEGLAFRAKRSRVWAYGEQVLADVTAGDRSAPTYDELIAEIDENLPIGIEPSGALTATG